MSRSIVRPRRPEHNPPLLAEVLAGPLPFAIGQPLPFAAIPHALIADRRLTATDVRLVGVLLKFARGKPECWPAVATLAAELDRSVRTVQYALRRLQEAGWISVRPDGNPTGRAIVLTWRGGATPAAPPVQAYSQGLPRPSPRPVAPQGDGLKEKVVPPRRETGPASAEELRTLWAPLLDYPEGHPLREMVLRQIAARG